MSNASVTRYKHPRRSFSPGPAREEVVLGGSFTVFRPVDSEPATEVSQDLYVMASHIPGIQIAGRRGIPTARLTLLEHLESASHPGVRNMPVDELEAKLVEFVPDLGNPGPYPVKSIGAFAVNSGLGSDGVNMIPIGAFIGSAEQTLEPERQVLESFMCELDGVPPEPLEPKPMHADFAALPLGSKPSHIALVKEIIAESLPQEILFDRPAFEIS